jgi:hypothetical protein
LFANLTFDTLSSSIVNATLYNLTLPSTPLTFIVPIFWSVAHFANNVASTASASTQTVHSETTTSHLAQSIVLAVIVLLFAKST